LILRRAIGLACGLAALAASAAIAVVALAFALYSALLPAWGPALAAAGVAGSCVLVCLLGGLTAVFAAMPKAVRHDETPQTLTSRALGLARENPILAVLAVALVGFVAARNPKITAALVASFLSGRPPNKT
jgi:hypothetical protein